MSFIPAAVTWSPNIILVNGDYVDHVAFDLIVNFERMIGRRIPPADLPKWVDCVGLDGGLRPGENQTQVVFLHGMDSDRLNNFTMGNYGEDLDGKAFRDNLGEFTLHSVREEGPVSLDDLYAEAFETLLTSSQVKRVMLVTDMDRNFNRLRSIAEQSEAEDKREITFFAMSPLPGSRCFHSEILGYSLMAAMGISGEELQ